MYTHLFDDKIAICWVRSHCPQGITLSCEETYDTQSVQNILTLGKDSWYLEITCSRDGGIVFNNDSGKKQEYCHSTGPRTNHQLYISPAEKFHFGEGRLLIVRLWHDSRQRLENLSNS